MNKIITFDEKYRDLAINHIAAAMLTKDGEDRWTPDPASPCIPGAVYSGFTGWLPHSPMCPVNRLAFVQTYGEEVAAQLEALASVKAVKIRNLGTDSEWADHAKAAEATKAKPVSEWAIGDFVLALDCGFKFDHENIHKQIRYFIEGEAEDAENAGHRNDYRRVRPRLCRITRIEDRPSYFFNDEKALEGWTAQKSENGEGYEGGCCSDDVPDGMDIGNLPKFERDAYINTFYSLCVLVRSSSGEYVLIDPDGYEYPHYVLLPMNYRELFAPVVTGIVAARELERVQAEEAKKAEAEKARAEYDARCAKWAPIMKPLTPGADWKIREKEKKDNILAMARHAFPGVYFTLRKSCGWGDGMHLSWTNGPTEEEMAAATDFDLFCTGRDTFNGMDDSTGVDRARFQDFANTYGAAFNGVDFDRTEAETDRNRKPSAVLPNAPAAVSIDGEVTVTENTEKNGIEIRFARKPSPNVLNRIKERHCWRWSKFSKCWYTKANATEREFAHALAEGRDNRRHEDVPGNLDAMLGY